MSVSRRQFLQNGVLVAAACAAPPLPAWTRNNPPLNRESEVNHAFAAHQAGLTRQAFASLVGSAFKVSQSSGKGSLQWLRLKAVQDLPALVPVDPRSMDVPPKRSLQIVSTSGFMLSFRGTGPGLPQGTYVFEHDRLGKFGLFIVPGQPGLGLYTAVFNHLERIAVIARDRRDRA